MTSKRYFYILEKTNKGVNFMKLKYMCLLSVGLLSFLSLASPQHSNVKDKQKQIISVDTNVSGDVKCHIKSDLFCD